MGTEGLTAVGTVVDGEVVAGLVNDGSAGRVARAAVAEAVRHRRPVRFVQVVSRDLGPEARADADAVTFQAALTALRGHARLRCTFEVVGGRAAQVLVQRSRHATVLFVGEDDPAPNASVAQYCQQHAVCTVRMISAISGNPADGDVPENLCPTHEPIGTGNGS